MRALPDAEYRRNAALDSPLPPAPRPRAVTPQGGVSVTKLVRQLRQAVRDNNLERALLFVEDGAPADTMLENGETLLTLCASNGEAEFCGMVLISGADVNWVNDFGRTALFKAASAGHVEIVEMLLANGADPFVRDHPSGARAGERGRTALDWAGIARRDACKAVLQRAMVSFVLEHRGEAAELQLIDEMQLVVQANEDLVVQIEEVLRTMESVNVALLVAEAPITRTRWLKARLHLRGCGALAPDVADSMVFFLDHETSTGVTALTKCAMSGDAASLERVVEFEATVDHITAIGHSALTWAAAGGHKECVRVLLHYGAQPELTMNRGGTGARKKTALIYAAMNDRPEVVQCLLEAHFEESLRFRLRKIEEADAARTRVEKNQLLAADWVRYYRGVLNHRDAEGKTAMEWAARQGFRNVISFLKNAESRIEERQRLLDNEARHAELVMCPLGCGFADRRDSIARHERVFCVRRLVPCPRGCDARVPEEDIPAHLDSICSKRLVRCVNVYAGCYQLLELGERENHERYHCRKRMDVCRLGCGAPLLWDARQDHEKQVCELRITICRLCGCEEPVRTMLTHRKNRCPLRPTHCALCDELFPLGEMEAHLEWCRQPCKFGCGEVIGPLARREAHELNACPFRPIVCPLQCGETFRSQDLKHHTRLECPKRLVFCRLNCGLEIQEDTRAAHEDAWRGECSERRVRCRRELATTRKRLAVRGLDVVIAENDAAEAAVAAKDEEAYDDVDDDAPAAVSPSASTKVSKEVTVTVFTVEDDEDKSVDKSAASNDSAAYGDIDVDESVESSEEEEEEELVDPEKHAVRSDAQGGAAQRTQQVAATSAEQKGLAGKGARKRAAAATAAAAAAAERVQTVTCVRFNPETAQHQLLLTDGRRVWINLGDRRITARVLDGSDADFNPNNRKARRFLLKAYRDAIHKATEQTKGCSEAERTVALATVDSDHPLAKMMADEGVVFIEDGANDDDEDFGDAPYGTWVCGWMAADEQAQHEHGKCVYFVVPCPSGCGASLQQKSVDRHLRSACPNRAITCALCQNPVLEGRQAEHNENECTRRGLRCDCGALVPACEMEAHLADVCSRRFMRCPLGCGEHVRAQEMTTHTARGCSRRAVTCPHGCGTCPIWPSELEQHLSDECPRRPVSCPTGCGFTLPAADMELHYRTKCSHRPMQCAHCGTPGISAHKMVSHLRVDCPAAPVLCTQGCGQRVRRDYLQIHEIEECDRRMIECPEGCGARIRNHLKKHHMNSCAKATLPCPLKCNLMIRREALGDHLLLCRRRLMLCGCAVEADIRSNCCARPISWWIRPPARRVFTSSGAGAEGVADWYASDPVVAAQAEEVYAEDFARLRPHRQRELASPMRLCTKHGDSVIAYCAGRNEWAVLADLLQHPHIRAAIDHIGSQGTTALAAAARAGHVEAARTLLMSGADPNHASKSGRTALHEACRFGCTDMVALLMEFGVDVRQPNAARVVASEWALQWGFRDLARTLQETIVVQDSRGRMFEAIARHDTALVAQMTRGGKPHHLDHVDILSKRRTAIEALVVETEGKRDVKHYEDVKAIMLQHKIVVDAHNARVDVLKVEAEGLRTKYEKHAARLRAIQQRTNRRIGALGRGDIDDALNLRRPRANVKEVLEMSAETICKLIGIDSVKVKDPRGTGRMLDEWWKPLQHRLKPQQARDFGSLLEEVPVFDAKRATPELIETILASNAYANKYMQKEALKEATGIAMLRKLKAKPSALNAMQKLKLKRPGGAAKEGNGEGGAGEAANVDADDGLTGKHFSPIFDYPMAGAAEINSAWRESATRDISGDVDRVSTVSGDDGGGHISDSDSDDDDEANVMKNLPRLLRVLGEWASMVLLIAREGRVGEPWRDQSIELSGRATRLYATGWQDRERFKTADRIYQWAESSEKDLTEKLTAARDELKEVERSLFVGRVLEDGGLSSLGTVSRHTPLSYAIVCGHNDIVQMLLRRGAAPGYDDTLLKASAAVIQHVRRRQVEKRNLPPWTRATSLERRKDEIVSDMVLSFKRRKMRSLLGATRVPLCEAAYNGFAPVVKTLLKEGASAFALTYIHPCGPPPRPMNAELLTPLEEGMSLMECAAAGLEHIGCRTLVRGAWVPGRHEQMIAVIEPQYAQLGIARHKRTADITGKKRAIAKRIELKAINAQLEVAIATMQFERVLELVHGGGNVDYESVDGFTALMIAAGSEAEVRVEVGESLLRVHNEHFVVEEDAPSAAAQKRVDAAVAQSAIEDASAAADAEDGGGVGSKKKTKAILAVSFLLDRPPMDPRPRIDRASEKLGHTPLSWAAFRGKTRAVEVLLDHGAAVDARSTSGKTALIHAAGNGQWAAVRLLIERGADVNAEDNEGETAMKKAQNSNFSGVVARLNESRARFYGPVCASHGVAVVTSPCPLGCGELLTAADVDEHIESLCGKRPTVCEVCHAPIAWIEQLAAHQATCCKGRKVECPNNCLKSLYPSEMKLHLKRTCTKREVTCPYMCGRKVPIGTLQPHCELQCGRRLMPCDLNCGIQVEADLQRTHRLRHCPKRVIKCKLECGMIMEAGARVDHETRICRNRVITCKWEGCGEVFKAIDLLRHERLDCKHRDVECTNRCGLKVPFSTMAEHMAETCVMRWIPCPNGCGMKVRARASDVEFHTHGACGMRIVKCRMGCGADVLYKNLVEHESKQCVFRCVPCGNGCGELVRVKDRATHYAEECCKRVVPCRLGCPKENIKEEEMVDHLRWQCRFRSVFCTQGCGAEVTFKKLKGHEKRECPMRFVPCQFGCDVLFRACEKLAHEKTCSRRVMEKKKGKFAVGSSLRKGGRPSPVSRKSSLASPRSGASPRGTAGRGAATPRTPRTPRTPHTARAAP